MNFHQDSALKKISYFSSTRAWTWGMFILLAAVNLIWVKYRFGDTNHAFMVPILKSYFDPQLYPNDPMIQVRSHYVTFYWLALGALAKIFGDLERVCFVVHLLTIAALFGSIFQLAKTIFNDRLVGIVAVILMFPERFDLELGGGFLDYAYHTHTLVVAPLALWAIIFFLRGKTRWAYLSLGIIFNMHAQTATHLFPMLALASLINYRERGIKQLIIDWSIFLLTSAPCLVWILTASAGSMDQQWLTLFRMRSASHCFPSTWPQGQFVTYATFFCAGLFAWVKAYRATSPSKSHLAFAWFAVVFLLLCGAGYFFAEIWPIKIVIRSALFRASAYMTIFIMLYLSYSCVTLWKKTGLDKLCAILLFCALFFPAYRPFLLLFLFFYFWREQKEFSWWMLAPIAGVVLWRTSLPQVAFIDNLDFRPLLALGSFFFDKPLPALALLLVFAFLAIEQWPLNFHPLVKKISGVMIMLIVGLFAAATAQQLIKPISSRGDWVAVQLWAKRNTTKNTLFLTPPFHEGFRVFSERSTVVEWKDGTMMSFDGPYAQKWFKRLKDVGETHGRFEQLSVEQTKQLAQTYGATYLISQGRRPWPLKIAHENKTFTVYEIGERFENIFLGICQSSALFPLSAQTESK